MFDQGFIVLLSRGQHWKKYVENRQPAGIRGTIKFSPLEVFNKLVQGGINQGRQSMWVTQ